MGILRGNQGRGVKSLTWRLEARGLVAWGGRGRWGQAAARWGSTGVRWGMELMGGARKVVT
jgi:hypothetical protein